MNLFTSLQRNIKLRNIHNITSQYIHYYFGYGNPGKTQDEKTDVAVRYGIYNIKIWNFNNQQVKYTQPGKLKPQQNHCATQQQNLATLCSCTTLRHRYDMLYGIHMDVDVNSTDPYRTK